MQAWHNMQNYFEHTKKGIVHTHMHTLIYTHTSYCVNGKYFTLKRKCRSISISRSNQVSTNLHLPLLTPYITGNVNREGLTKRSRRGNWEKENNQWENKWNNKVQVTWGHMSVRLRKELWWGLFFWRRFITTFTCFCVCAVLCECRFQPAGLVEKIQAIAQNVSNMAIRVEQILQSSMIQGRGTVSLLSLGCSLSWQ